MKEAEMAKRNFSRHDLPDELVAWHALAREVEAKRAAVERTRAQLEDAVMAHEEAKTAEERARQVLAAVSSVSGKKT